MLFKISFQAVKYLQMMVIQARRQHKAQMDIDNKGKNFDNNKQIQIDPKTWVKLGHFHLLLEEYRKGKR